LRIREFFLTLFPGVIIHLFVGSFEECLSFPKACHLSEDRDGLFSLVVCSEPVCKKLCVDAWLYM
jgi:hypothetical protein